MDIFSPPYFKIKTVVNFNYVIFSFRLSVTWGRNLSVTVFHVTILSYNSLSRLSSTNKFIKFVLSSWTLEDLEFEI